MTLDELNALDDEPFVARLGGIAENAPWVAALAGTARPFETVEQVVAAFRAAILGAPEADRRALVAGHPDLAGRAALAGELTADSTREQASAGLDRLSVGELAELTRLNAAYRARFGFPFVICVREHTKESIMDSLRARLENDPGGELDVAVGEVVTIVRLRLEALLA